MKPSLTQRCTLHLLLKAVLLAGLITTTAHADTLSYDPVGNIASRTTAQGTITYSYDALSRLTAETSPTGSQSYTYDANGNRLSDGLGNYTYSPTSNRITSRYGKAITTDAAGNITADGQGHTYVYNQRGYLSEARLNGVLLASYTYDYRGLRTRKVTTAAAPQGAQVVRYTYDEAHHLIAETSGTGAAIRSYVWRDDTPIAQIDHVPSRRIIYLETDHLNTPRVARDQARNVVWTWDSDAFGATPPNPNPSGLGVVTINLRFPGQYYDQETGLHYNGFRYYHPGMGQYIQPDPIGLRGGSFSTYAYVGGNPLRWVDPSGLAGSTRGSAPPRSSGYGNQLAYDLTLAQIRAIRPDYRPPASIGNRDSEVSEAEVAMLRAELMNLRNNQSQNQYQCTAKGGTYVLRDELENIVRSGRTNNLDRRRNEHFRDPALRDYTFDPVHRTDDYAEQRGLEQILHDTYNPPLNRINPISPNNPNGQGYSNAANNYLNGGN